MLDVSPAIKIPLEELQFAYSKSSGPGGQNVNKLNTKAELRWDLRATKSLPADVRERFLAAYKNRITVDGALVLTSQRFRDAMSNTQDCLDKLKALILAVAKKPRPRKPTRPTKGSIKRRLEDKNARSQKKRGRTERWE